ncbi:hypothetical protein LCGC14_0398900 [marine sediment metagenome]|uniref:Uncharacterized protein n=1 Tax=marine sediment metagenome TaxID=412755 RepID=A0A0F9T2U5_9ZZZZ|nr:hypothetical protein [Candidatus Aminicenantes bacterium]
MELIKVADKIEHRINLLAKGREVIQERAENKARKIADYEKELALTLIKMKEGVEMELEGHSIKALPVSIMEKVAKGMCWKEKLDMEQADAEYRNAIAGMHALEAELNGWQSIFRHLEER